MPKSGQMDRRITIRRATVTKNDLGENVESWSDLATVWSAKEDIRDGERFAAQQTAAEITTRFRIRYSPTVADVNPKDRLLYGEQTYGIVAVKEIGRRDGLEITASARAD